MTPDELHSKVIELKDMLEKQNPGMEMWLRDIHMNLQKDESLVQVISEEELGIIVRSLEVKAKIKIVSDIKNSKNKKPLSQLSLDDL